MDCRVDQPDGVPRLHLWVNGEARPAPPAETKDGRFYRFELGAFALGEQVAYQLTTDGEQSRVFDRPVFCIDRWRKIQVSLCCYAHNREADAMTIKEIANSLGVSTATVSNVIHGHLEKMSPETAQLIRQKLEEYQYIPNMSARMLAKGDSEIVGVITNYPNREEKFALQDPFVSEMIAALENAIRSNGYYTMLQAAQTAAEIHRISQTWNAVGLIVMGLQANQCRELMQVTRKPIVFVDCYFDQGEQYNNIGLDDQGGMAQMTRHLLKMGHRNILMVGDQPTLWGVDARRLLGHQQELKEAGIDWSPWRFFCISKDRKRRDGDYERLLAYARQRQITACMFTSDYYAVEAMDYWLDHGVQVPQDLSVTGFDDNILSRIIRPRLTTVHQDVTQKAQVALRTLLSIVEKRVEEPVTVTLPTRITRGKSVKDLRNTL